MAFFWSKAIFAEKCLFSGLFRPFGNSAEGTRKTQKDPLAGVATPATESQCGGVAGHSVRGFALDVDWPTAATAYSIATCIS